MQVIKVILFSLLLQVKASFFSDFTGAMSSVENAFGKLLNDVVTDVKSTVHCTILAMEHVLAINGVMVEPLANNECNDHNANTGNDNIIYNSEADIATQIHSTISRVNKTLSNILDNSGHRRIQDVKRDLKKESDHLIKISNLLREELEKISQRTGKEFQSKDFNFDESSVGTLWNEMKILHDIERDDKNISEVREIGNVFNEALSILHVNMNGEQKSDEEKIQAIMLEVEHEADKKNAEISDTINREISEWKSGFKRVSEETSKSFKGKEKNEKEVDQNVETNSFSGNSEENTPFTNMNSIDKAKAVDEAMGVFNEAVKSEAIIDELFRQEKNGVDVFKNSNLFNDFK